MPATRADGRRAHPARQTSPVPVAPSPMSSPEPGRGSVPESGRGSVPGAGPVSPTAPAAPPPPASGPLAGIRVLDLTSVVMGPYATQLLGDLGADVISVEDVRGDTNRVMGPGPEPGMSGVSLNLLRNKRNVCLDLKQPAGREALLRILATCDVFVTNLRPGPLGRLRLTYDDVSAVRPDIVMCQACGWPADGPRSDRPAYDDVIQAGCGIAAAFQLQHGAPSVAPTLVADKVAGLTITYGLLAALLHRERTGQGQLVEVPMIDALTAFTLVEHGCAAVPEPPLGPAGYPRILVPERRPFATSDGWIAVLPYSQDNFEQLFRAGGRDDLLDDPRIRTAASRMEHASALYGLVEQIVARRPTAWWVELCAAHDIPAAAVASLDELVASQPVAVHPTLGPYHQISSPTRFSASPTSVRRHAPRLGEHTDEVLREVGLDDAEIVAARVTRRTRDA
jgi:crotonobetainyl-CoA:carnitine CoA-transferase CaiB-like acyl-CoA transferase